MQEVQEKMLKARIRQKKTASDIGEKVGKTKNKQYRQTQKMTLEQQEEYWKLKKKP